MTHTHTTELERVAKRLFEIALELDKQGEIQRKKANKAQAKDMRGTSANATYRRGAQDAYRHAAGFVWSLFNSIGDIKGPVEPVVIGDRCSVCGVHSSIPCRCGEGS